MPESTLIFSDKLLQWFDQHGRKDLPWQSNKTPYRVWVSEIMLQQTQVSSVIEYYQRFMKSFPNLKVLAHAHEDKVLEHWAGLGYYARARNLHKTAKIIQQEHHGVFPSTLEDITSLPGIGRSTAGAILSIAFKKPACILDGNVKRVLCRYEAINSWSGESKTEKKLWLLAEQLTPDKRNGDYTQAIMDLGATLCTRSKPQCKHCPLQTNCQANKLNLQSSLPVAKPKKDIPQKQTWITLIESIDNQILLEKRPPSGIWGSLYSLPEFNPDIDLSDIPNYCQQQFGGKFEQIETHNSIHHTFSHFKLELKPIKLLSVQPQTKIQDNERFIWFNKTQLHTLGMPAPISRYIKNFLLNNLNERSL